jgi:hypothetical protein
LGLLHFGADPFIAKGTTLQILGKEEHESKRADIRSPVAQPSKAKVPARAQGHAAGLSMCGRARSPHSAAGLASGGILPGIRKDTLGHGCVAELAKKPREPLGHVRVGRLSPVP